MKLVNRIKENKGNNKGFSLVELIIVIAIMAILVGIVGTQVIPYINRSRVAKDQQILSSLLTDGTSAFSMNAEKAVNNTKIELSRTAATDPFTIGGDADAAIISTFKELNGDTAATTLALSLSSTEGKKITKITILYSDTAGISLYTDGTTSADLYGGSANAIKSSK